MTSQGITAAYGHLKQAQRSLNALLQEQFTSALEPEVTEALASIAQAQACLLEVRERAASRAMTFPEPAGKNRTAGGSRNDPEDQNE